jgi:hypothetical protein
MGYCTLVDLRSTLRITDDLDDDVLERAINAATARIDGHCHRTFVQEATVTARLFHADSNVVVVDDISTAAGVVVELWNGSAYTPTSDYLLEPLNAFAKGRPVTAVRNTKGWWYQLTAQPALQVSARWGWPAVPVDVREACVILAGRMFKRGDSLLGVAGFGDLGAITVRSVDPDIRDLLNPYIRHTGIA